MTKTLIFLFIILLSNISNAENKLNDYEIESVIKKYILENPEIIIQSLEQYTISQKEKESKGITSILNLSWIEGTKLSERLFRAFVILLLIEKDKLIKKKR